MYGKISIQFGWYGKMYVTIQSSHGSNLIYILEICSDFVGLEASKIVSSTIFAYGITALILLNVPWEFSNSRQLWTGMILLMEEILHHLGWLKPYK